MSTNDSPALTVTNLVHGYGDRPIIDLAEWRVPQGTHTMILGPSGSGKSTLLHLVAGLLRPDQGDIRVAGQDMTALRGAALDRFRGRNIGIVLQSLHLIAALSVYDNIRLACTLADLVPDASHIDHLLAELGLNALTGKRPATLSQGERQRVAIARAVVNRPTLLLADEPTSALDDANCDAVVKLLVDQATGANATLIIATHDARLKDHFGERLELGAPT